MRKEKDERYESTRRNPSVLYVHSTSAFEAQCYKFSPLIPTRVRVVISSGGVEQQHGRHTRLVYVSMEFGGVQWGKG